VDNGGVNGGGSFKVKRGSDARELVHVARDKVFNILNGENIIVSSRPEFVWSFGFWWEQIPKNESSGEEQSQNQIVETK